MVKNFDINIGRGKLMSIAKAGLVVFYEAPFKTGMINYGQLDVIHDIIETAGAKQQGFYSHYQVTRLLAKSPFWNKEFSPKHYSGMRGQQGCNNFAPSKKGKQYYETHLKGKNLYKKS